MPQNYQYAHYIYKKLSANPVSMISNISKLHVKSSGKTFEKSTRTLALLYLVSIGPIDIILMYCIPEPVYVDYGDHRSP